MSDLIDRQAAIDELDKGAWGVEWDKALAKAMLENLPSAQQWIPCSERMPDEDYWTGANFQHSADVLMTVYNAEDEEIIIDYGHTVDGSWYSDTTDCLVPSWWEVLAWMPLPSPYKGEQE